MSLLPPTARTALAGAALIALAGCAPRAALPVAPTVLSSDWRGGRPSAAMAAPANLGAALGSAKLEQLIARALAANADIGAAAARVLEARAQLQIARGSMLPVVNASAGLSTTRTDNEGGTLFEFSDAFAQAEVSYELDLFGRLAAERRSARARLAAAAHDRDALALIVQAEVARAFVQHAALGDRLALLDRNLANARELERIIGVRRRLGEATLVETGLQAIEIRELEAERSRLVEARSRTGSALAILLGAEAPMFTPPAAALADFVPPSLEVPQPAGLVRRPDIRAAEARIAAAKGDVDQARATFLPRVSLAGSVLGQAASLGGPLGATLSAGVELLAPIFDRGRLDGGLNLATASQLESVELYRKALLTALAETEDALAAVEQSRAREALLTDIVEEARTTTRLVRLQYIEGEVDLQNLLDAERQLVEAEDARAVAAQERLEAAIDLYRAIGGAPADARPAPRLELVLPV